MSATCILFHFSVHIGLMKRYSAAAMCSNSVLLSLIALERSDRCTIMSKCLSYSCKHSRLCFKINLNGCGCGQHVFKSVPHIKPPASEGLEYNHTETFTVLLSHFGA